MKHKLTAAPVIKQHKSLMPAPAYTDFVKIYVDEALSAAEENVAIRHEQAHIWCEHNLRSRKDRVDEIWRVSCELEIARNIYTVEDIAVISRPRSRLSGGYLPSSINELPEEIILAEEIYDWLINNQDKMLQKQSFCSCSCISENEEEKVQTDEPGELVSAAKEADEKNEIQKQIQENISSKIKTVKHRQPSLADELDALLRHRIVRERSYRRPSRRTGDESIIEKGLYSSQRRPLIEVFVDRSGSFDGTKTSIAETVLKMVLLKYNVQIKYDVFFFGNDKLSPNDFVGGGNTPYHLIVKHIEKTQPKIALVITDDDAAHSTKIKAKTNIMCLPVGARSTKFAAATGGKDISF